MKSFIKILLLISIFIGTIEAKPINVNQILQMAKQKDKKIMFFFHIPYCHYCESMLDENFKDKNTLKYIKKYFILVDIYSTKKQIVIFKNFKGTHKEFAKYLNTKAVPATFFMDKEGKIIHKAIGYRNIDEYLVEMKYVSTNSYKSQQFEAFKQKLEFESDD